MAKVYYRKVKAGDMKISEVPPRWRAEVEALLAQDSGK